MHTTQARVQYQGGVQLIKILALKQNGPEVIYKLTWSQKSPEQSLFPGPKTGRPAVWRSSQSCGCDCWLWACCVRLWPGGRIKQHLRKLLLITAQPVRTYPDTGKQNLITELITVSEFLHHYFFSPMCLCRGGRKFNFKHEPRWCRKCFIFSQLNWSRSDCMNQNRTCVWSELVFSVMIVLLVHVFNDLIQELNLQHWQLTSDSSEFSGTNVKKKNVIT